MNLFLTFASEICSNYFLFFLAFVISLTMNGFLKEGILSFKGIESRMRFDEGRLKDILYAFERMKGCFSKEGPSIRNRLISLLLIDICLIILNFGLIPIKFNSSCRHLLEL